MRGPLVLQTPRDISSKPEPRALTHPEDRSREGGNRARAGRGPEARSISPPPRPPARCPYSWHEPRTIRAPQHPRAHRHLSAWLLFATPAATSFRAKSDSRDALEPGNRLKERGVMTSSLLASAGVRRRARRGSRAHDA